MLPTIMPEASDNPFKKRTDNSEEMEKLIHELIGERVLELSRYISINSISKTLIIDKTSLIRGGTIIITFLI